jgi:hypothetical protein
MANPVDRPSFTKYCLQQLGAPVIEINVDVDQVDNRIDEALSWWWDYHFEGSEKTYYTYAITDTDRANKYITLPDNIIGTISIFDIGTDVGTNNIFGVRYQFSLNDLYSINAAQSVVPYYMTMQYLQLLEQILVGKMPIRFNRHNSRLYIDGDWNRFSGSGFFLVEAYQIVDPNVYTKAWNDRWLKKYATALIKKQWGNNLKKYDGMEMPGGLKFNGQKIYDEAAEEIQEIEDHVIGSYSMPALDMIG